ncbi:MAG TPA: 6-phosphogluconolactonase [Gemmatimonadales bacterium]|nr:6-phosphogluconolactonase [Gemmatimonadales bacterium]
MVVPPAEWAETAAQRIAKTLEAARTVVLAGGNSPRAVYTRLVTRTLAWDQIDVYFGDERAVPPDDPSSNYGMAAETLLDPARVPSERRHRMPAERQDREAAAREYAELLPDRPDLLLVGIGADGHIASLFPGSPAVMEQEQRVIPVEGPGSAGWRLTVTPPVIAAARSRIVLAYGNSKAAAVERALVGSGAVSDCPARLVREAVWMLDREAASRLGRTAP